MSCKKFKSLTSTQKQELLHEPSVAVATALNINGIEHNGSKVTAISYENGTLNVVDKDGKDINIDMQEPSDVKWKDGNIIDNEYLSVLYSDMNFIKNTTGSNETLAVDIVNDPDTMLGLATDIDSLNPESDPVHKANLISALKRAINPLKNALPKMTVLLNKEAARNQGMIGISDSSAVLEVSIGPGKSFMSPLEVYVHEIYHAATDYVLSAKGAKHAGLKNDITRIRDEFFAYPDLIKELTKHTGSEKDTTELLDYLSDPEVGLKEFVAYSQTHKPVMEVLKKINTKGEIKEEYPNLFSRLAAWVNQMFNAFQTRITGMPTSNDYDRMVFLVDRLITANNKQLDAKRESVIGKTMQKFSEIDERIGNKVKAWIEEDKKNIKFLKKDATKFDEALYILKTVGRSFYNEEARKMVTTQLSYMGVEETGTIQSTFGEMFDNDVTKDHAEGITQQASDLNRRREAERVITKEEIRAAFDKPLSARDKRALNVILDTDLVSLGEKYPVSSLINPENGRENLNKAISDIEKELKDKHGTALLNYYTFQSKILARYMRTGIGHRLLLKNADNIARRLNDVSKLKKSDAYTTELIDSLVSLYALKESDKGTKTHLYNMMQEQPVGVSVFAYYAEYNKRYSEDNLFKGRSRAQEIKGYRTANIPQEIETTIRPLREEREMAAKGFKLVGPTNNHPGDKADPLGFYVSELPIRSKFHRGAVLYKNMTHRGTSIREGHFIARGKNGALLGDTDVNNLETGNMRLLDKVKMGIYEETEEDKQLTPRYDSRGSLLDFDYTMTRDEQVKYLKSDIDPINTVANVRASNYDKVEVPKHNEKAFDLIRKDMKNMYDRGELTLDKGIGKNNRNYLWVGEDSSDPELQALWRMLPDNIRNDFTEIRDTEQEVKGFYVRADLLHMLLGYQEMSLVETNLGRRLSPGLQHQLRLAGKIWKDIITIYKGNILLRIPEVLLFNVVSNFAFSIFYGMNPAKVAKYQSVAVKELNSFIKDSKEQIHLETLKKIGKITPEQSRRLNIITNKINNSDIKPLIDEGFYTQILEEMEADEESGNIVKDKISEKLEGVPTVVKNGLNWVWLPDANPIVKFMNASTQYSDFIARYAHYNLMREQGKGHQESINQVRSMFINYSKPSSPFVEWANQMGLVMFTKYFTRIQKAIGHLAKGHPLSMFLILLGQEALLDIPDVTDAHVLNADLSYKFYNPVESLIGAATPGSYLMLKDIM